jgi:hypothetical protein
MSPGVPKCEIPRFSNPPVLSLRKELRSATRLRGNDETELEVASYAAGWRFQEAPISWALVSDFGFSEE